MNQLALRAHHGHRYMTALRDLRKENWFSLRNDWDQLQSWERLVLIHPDWLRESRGPDFTFEEIQGSRSFSGGRPQGECASLRIWGYECPTNGRLEVDHVWPYALGGPTKPGNSLALCRDHNALKGVDIHAYPWEESPSPTDLWLQNQISLIAYALGERS